MRFVKNRAATLIFVVSLGLLLLISVGYHFSWTGFNERIGPDVQQYQPAKTLWDWLQLLIIPLLLAIGVFSLNQIQNLTEREISLDNQEEIAFQTYIDRMSELLLVYDLSSSKTKSVVKNMARTRTLTILSRLNGERKGRVIRFLQEANLLDVIPLQKADFREADLRGVDFSNVNLDKIDFRWANLTEANLEGASLREAKLSHVNISGANLLSANLDNSDFRKASFRSANLKGASLKKAQLFKVDFTSAELTEAIFSNALLKGAKLTSKQLDSVNTLHDAIMPDGSKHQ